MAVPLCSVYILWMLRQNFSYFLILLLMICRLSRMIWTSSGVLLTLKWVDCVAEVKMPQLRFAFYGTLAVLLKGCFWHL